MMAHKVKVCQKKMQLFFFSNCFCLPPRIFHPQCLHRLDVVLIDLQVLYGAQVLRLHYANCNTYNADFDGDEINLHFPQNGMFQQKKNIPRSFCVRLPVYAFIIELARTEAKFIANTAEQYLTPKDGSPLRGISDLRCSANL